MAKAEALLKQLTKKEKMLTDYIKNLQKQKQKTNKATK